MRNTQKLGNLIRAYANDEESSRFTDSQINSLLNSSGKKILRMLPSSSKSLTSLREFVWWQFADMDINGANNPSSHEFDLGEKVINQSMELLSSNHLLGCFVVKKLAIASPNIQISDIVHRNVPTENYWDDLEDITKAPQEDIADTSGNITQENEFSFHLAGDGVTENLIETTQCEIIEVDDMDMRSEWSHKPTILRPIVVVYNKKLYVYPKYLASTDDQHWMFAVEFIRSPNDINIGTASQMEWNPDVDLAITYDVVSELYDIDGDTTRSAIFKEKLNAELMILGGTE